MVLPNQLMERGFPLEGSAESLHRFLANECASLLSVSPLFAQGLDRVRGRSHNGDPVRLVEHTEGFELRVLANVALFTQLAALADQRLGALERSA